jgi:2-methylisocitrate lyase-like PEP mutase family enzyme
MVSQDQKAKAELFLKFHHDKEILVLLNSWDPGSSRLIEASGFKAIATTSMGIAASLAYPDVARLSLGSSLQKSTLALVRRIANEIRLEGTYGILSDSLKPLENTIAAYRMAAGIS